MKRKILFTEDHYTVQLHQGVSKKAIKFFESTSWGSEGAVYENRNTKHHIKLLHKPMLLAMHEGEEIKATAVYCNTPVTVNSAEFNCKYFKYVASDKSVRRKGIMKKYANKFMTLIRQDEDAKTIYFACVENGNKPSYKLISGAGYVHVGTVKTMGFSRFFPKENNKVEQIIGEEGQGEVIEILKEAYRSHALVQFQSIFMNQDYYVLRVDGEIVAGCQYHRGHWVINKMKGLSGKLIMKIVPKIPLINKIFNPKKFEFLTFEGIYLKNGHISELQNLFSHLLAKENLKSAMYWMGKECPIREKIDKMSQHGLIHSFIKDNDVLVMAAFENLNDAEIQSVHSQALYASGFDYT